MARPFKVAEVAQTLRGGQDILPPTVEKTKNMYMVWNEKEVVYTTSQVGLALKHAYTAALPYLGCTNATGEWVFDEKERRAWPTFLCPENHVHSHQWTEYHIDMIKEAWAKFPPIRIEILPLAVLAKH